MLITFIALRSASLNPASDYWITDFSLIDDSGLEIQSDPVLNSLVPCPFPECPCLVSVLLPPILPVCLAVQARGARCP